MAKKKKAYLLLIIILGIFWFLLYQSGPLARPWIDNKAKRPYEKAAPKVRVQTVKQQDKIQVPIFLSGKIKPKKYTLIKSRVNGFLEYIAPIGDEVRTGQELFKIYDEGIETNYYNILSSLITAQNNLKEVEATIDKSIKQAELAVKNNESAKALAESNLKTVEAGSKASLALAENNFESAKRSASQGLETALDSGRANWSSTYNAVDQTMRFLSGGDIREYVFGSFLSYNAQVRIDANNQFIKAKRLYSEISNSSSDSPLVSFDNSNNGVEPGLEAIGLAVEEVKKLADLVYIDLNYCLATETVAQAAIDGYKAQLTALLVSLNVANSGTKMAKNAIKTARISGESAVGAAEQGLKIAQAQYDSGVQAVETQAEQAKNALENSKVGLELAKSGAEIKRLAAWAQVNGAQSQFDAAKYQFDNLIMPAKFSGVIISNLAEEGEQVNIGMPVLEMGDIEAVEIELELGTREVRQLRIGQEVRIFSGDKSVANNFGILTEIEPAALGVSGKVKVVVEADNSNYQFVPGEVAEVELNLEYRGKEMIVVPLSAVVVGQNESYVWVVNTDDDGLKQMTTDYTDTADNEINKVNKRTVETGEVYGGVMEVTSGLEDGDKVVVEGGGFLSEGDEVEISSS